MHAHTHEARSDNNKHLNAHNTLVDRGERKEKRNVSVKNYAGSAREGGEIGSSEGFERRCYLSTACAAASVSKTQPSRVIFEMPPSGTVPFFSFGITKLSTPPERYGDDGHSPHPHDPLARTSHEKTELGCAVANKKKKRRVEGATEWRHSHCVFHARKN